MPGIVDVVIKAIDESTQTMSTVNAQYVTLNDQLTQLAQQEKANAVLLEAKEKFEGLSQSEKDALIAADDLAKSNQQLTEKTGGVGISMTDLSSGISVVKQSIEALNKAYDASIGVSQKYAEQVRDLKAITGESAQATSDLIQVADDFQISAEDLQASMKVLTKNGLVPNKETIISLAQQYQAIQDPLAKNEFLIKNLGRASSNYTNLLSQNTDELRKNFDSQAQNLQWGEKELVQAERLRLAQDQLADVQNHLAVTVGSQLTPAFSAWVDLINRAISQPETLRVGWEGFIPVIGPIITLMENYGDSFNKGAAETQNLVNAQEALKNKNVELIPTQEEVLAAQQKISEANTAMVSTINSIQQADEAYASSASTLHADRLAAEQELADAKARGYETSVGEYDGLQGKIDEIKLKEADLAKERDKQTLQFVSNIVLQKLSVDGLSTKEFDYFAKQQVAWGLWSEDAAKKASDVYAAADQVVSKLNEIQPKTVDINVQYNYSSNGTAGGTDGDPNTPRASGGPVMAGQSYVVGETGRERFVPAQNGTIIPAHQLATANAQGLSSGGQSMGGSQSITYQINLTYAPGVSMNDAESIKQFVYSGIRAAQADGLLPVGR